MTLLLISFHLDFTVLDFQTPKSKFCETNSSVGLFSVPLYQDCDIHLNVSFSLIFVQVQRKESFGV